MSQGLPDASPSMNPSATHLVLIPSYNPGPLVYETVRAARQQWNPVWVVVDEDPDGTAAGLQELAAADPGLGVLLLARNQGKGGAILHGCDQAASAGYTHALIMDADGQHPVELIPSFMAASVAAPDAMVLGMPVFDASAPGFASRAAGFPTPGLIWKRSGRALVIPCSASGSIPSSPCVK